MVNPKDRNYVAVVVPLAAGLELLNPNLATAPPEAKARGAITIAPTYVAFLDDQVAFYYDTLPAGPTTSTSARGPRPKGPSPSLPPRPR